MSRIKIQLVIWLFLPFITGAQEYLFNGDTLPLFFKGYTNTFVIKKPLNKSGTPLCFDRTVKVTANQTITENPNYYIEVLDTVSRFKGILNITKIKAHPDGYREKVFVDKFEFKIHPLPETFLFVGFAVKGEKLDPDQMDLKVGIKETYPETSFLIKEYTIEANKERLSVKSKKLTPQARAFILKQKKGEEIKISVLYADPLNRKRRVFGVFYL